MPYKYFVNEAVKMVWFDKNLIFSSQDFTAFSSLIVELNPNSIKCKLLIGFM